MSPHPIQELRDPEKNLSDGLWRMWEEICLTTQIRFFIAAHGQMRNNIKEGKK